MQSNGFVQSGVPIIAAGSEPVHLLFVPHDDPRACVDWTGALTLATFPERFLILGGGVIGLEMATIYEALGSRVTVVELMDQIIPGADRDLVAPLHKMMSRRGIRFHLQTALTRLDSQSARACCTFREVLPRAREKKSSIWSLSRLVGGRTVTGCAPKPLVSR